MSKEGFIEQRYIPRLHARFTSVQKRERERSEIETEKGLRWRQKGYGQKEMK